jgi:hypothetical protein
MYGPLAIQVLRRKLSFVTLIDMFCQYTYIYIIQQMLDVKTVFQIFYNLLETEISIKIKKLKTDNSSKYMKKDMTTFLETKNIIHDILLLYIYKSNGLSEHINRSIIILVPSMTLDYTNIYSQIL